MKNCSYHESIQFWLQLSLGVTFSTNTVRHFFSLEHQRTEGPNMMIYSWHNSFKAHNICYTGSYVSESDCVFSIHKKTHCFSYHTVTSFRVISCDVWIEVLLTINHSTHAYKLNKACIMSAIYWLGNPVPVTNIIGPHYVCFGGDRKSNIDPLMQLAKW